MLVTLHKMNQNTLFDRPSGSVLPLDPEQGCGLRDCALSQNLVIGGIFTGTSQYVKAALPSALTFQANNEEVAKTR